MERIDKSLDEFQKAIEKNNGFASQRRARKKVAAELFDISTDLADIEVANIMNRIGVYEISFGDKDVIE
tara:strand:+ start:131 stop:337 length:207 start_codon:yes stop_codon:yes gene_type:complete